MNVQTIMFALLRYELEGTNVSQEVKNAITPEILPALYKLAKAHDLVHMIANALDKLGCLTAESEARKHFLQQRNMAVYRYEQFRYELEEISRVLEETQVEHIPLKGSVLREYYPEPWHRTSCDIDVFLRKEDLEKAKQALQEKLGYEYAGHCPHDEQMNAPSGVHVELHFDLIEEHIAGQAKEILLEVWERSRPCQGHTYRKELTEEMFYFYHIAHMAKHFKEGGGCGVRSFMDIYIMEKSPFRASKASDELLEQGGYSAFEKVAKRLSKVWFMQEPHDELTEQMENFILRGGVYGSVDNRVSLQAARTKSKTAYFFSRLFLPYRQLKLDYPVLVKHKWLTPVYQVVRWCRILFKDKKNPTKEFEVNASISAEEKQKTTQFLDALGL